MARHDGHLDLTALELDVKLPENYADDLGPGLGAQITYGGREYPGTLTAVSPEVRDNYVTGRVRFSGKPADLAALADGRVWTAVDRDPIAGRTFAEMWDDAHTPENRCCCCGCSGCSCCGTPRDSCSDCCSRTRRASRQSAPGAAPRLVGIRA